MCFCLYYVMPENHTPINHEKRAAFYCSFGKRKFQNGQVINFVSSATCLFWQVCEQNGKVNDMMIDSRICSTLDLNI